MRNSIQHNKKTKRKKKRRCGREEEIAKVFLRETGNEEKFRLLDHIFSCPECLAEFSVLRGIRKKEHSLFDPEVEQTLEKTNAEQIKSIAKGELKALSRERKSRKHMLFSPGKTAAAAALLIAFVLTIYFIMLNRPEQIPLEREIGPETIRLLEPENTVDEWPIHFQWTPVKGVIEYKIEVLDSGLKLIYRKEKITESFFVLHDKISARLAKSKTYFWKVIAKLDKGKNIESEMGKFYLNGN